jgi:2-oxoglutaroyl-CoA hydrolase
MANLKRRAMRWPKSCAAPLAQRSAKKLMNDIEDAGLSLAIELESQCYGRLSSSDDFREGVAAFHQKRRPEFRGK